MAELEPGDHGALFYRNRVEQFAAAIPYIRIGLERNQRCLYIAADNSLSIVIKAMESGGIHFDRMVKEGRLVIATSDQTYLRDGSFKPERMIALIEEEVQKCLQDGFAALRATGELGWAAFLPLALDRLYEYEAILDSKFSPSFMALCQYNEAIFPRRIIDQMLRIHPKVIAREKLRNNPFYVGPKKSLDDLPEVAVDDLMLADENRRN